MPHVCGDEPEELRVILAEIEVCPTYVGMNRYYQTAQAHNDSMPHVCGDEPGGR